MSTETAVRKLDALEERVVALSEQLKSLRLNYAEAIARQDDLEQSLQSSREDNANLQRELDSLRLEVENHEPDIKREELKQRVDKVLLKFSELQL